jgi:hypothetical protein
VLEQKLACKKVTTRDKNNWKKDVHIKRDMSYQEGQERVFEMLEVG